MRNLFNWAAARLVAAFALVLPLAAMAVDYTGTDYAPWSYSAGCIVWRATSGQLFHASTVADVGVDGEGEIEIGQTYDFNTSGHPWQVFAKNQSAYTAPGKVLVFDEAGYNNNSDAQFAPFDFGGMWVNALQAENTPYCITDSASGGTDRTVYLGASGYSTYFRFDKSFTFDRNSPTKVMGEATVEIAAGATFQINARANKGAVVDAGNTLVLKGEGVLDVGSGLSVSGMLDLSAAAVPVIDGAVTLAEGSTLALPAGTSLDGEVSICTGTLTVGGKVNVKVGDTTDLYSLTVSDGKITKFEVAQTVFTSDYPTIVPAGITYTFVGGDSAENTVVLDALDVRGTLKTQGYFSFTNYKSNGSTLDVETGSLTLDPGNNWFNGTLTVEAGATFVNALAQDAVQYNGTFTANIYGTLAMGDTRWSLGSNNTINLHEGCTVTGSGSNSGYSALDWIENATATVNVYGTVNLAAPIRIRGTATVNVNVEAGANDGLTLAGTIGAGTIVKKGAGLINFTTNPPYAITAENGAFTFAVDATPTITYSEEPGAGTSMSMWYATQPTWKGTVVIGVLTNSPAAFPLDTYGNANSKIVLKGTTGSCYLNGTTTVPAEVVIDTDEDHVVEFNNGNSGQVGTFSKISGTGTLKLTAWGGCSGATYNINTISNFTGTLAINNAITRGGGGTFTIGIGNIVTTGATTPGSKVLNLTKTEVSGTTGNVVYNLDNALVNGEAATLLVGNNGIYIARLLITYPDSTTEYKYEQLAAVLGVLYTGYAPDKAGTVVTVLDGSDADLGDAFPLIYDYDSANHTYTLKTMVAYTGDAVKYYYSSIANAIATAEDADTVTLIADVTVDDSINVASGKAITLDLDGHTITGPEDGYAFSNAGTVSISGGTVSAGGIVTNTADGASVAISGGTYTATGDLFGNVEGGTIAVSGGTFNQSVADEYIAEGYEVTDNGDGTYGIRDYLGWLYEAADHPGYTGGWSNEVSYSEGKIIIEDGNTYTNATPSAGRFVTLEMTLSFDAENDEADDLGDVKTAIKLGSQGFMLYTSEIVESVSTPVWTNAVAEGVTPVTGDDYTFLFVLDLTNKTYTASLIDGATTNALTICDGSVANIPFASSGNAAPVQRIDFIGGGTVTSIKGSYEDGPAPAEEFVNGDEFGAVTLDTAQAAWLNGQNNYAALADKIATMSQDAFNKAYLLNLDITDPAYDGTFTFEVSDIDVGDTTVSVKVTLTRSCEFDGPIIGTLKLTGTDELGNAFEVKDSATITDAHFSAGDGEVTITFPKDANTKFFQPVIE